MRGKAKPSESPRRPAGAGLVVVVLVLSLAGTAHGQSPAGELDEAEGWDAAPTEAEARAFREAGGAETAATPRYEPFAEEEPRPLRRISSRWFWTTLALGLGLGAGAAVTGAYVLGLNRQYLEDPSDRLLRERGVSLQLSTNILLGAAAGMALISAVLAIFTDWASLRSRPDDEDPSFEARSFGVPFG